MTLRKTFKTLKRKTRKAIKTLKRRLYNIPIRTRVELIRHLPYKTRTKIRKLGKLDAQYRQRLLTRKQINKQDKIRNLEEDIKEKQEELQTLLKKMRTSNYLKKETAHEKQKRNITFGFKKPSNYNFSLHLTPKLFYKAQKLYNEIVEDQAKLQQLHRIPLYRLY